MITDCMGHPLDLDDDGNIRGSSGGKSKTFSLRGQRLNVLTHEKKLGGLSFCAKTGPCPCEAPCQWAEQALDALQRGVWPDLDRPLASHRPSDIRL